MRYRVPADRLAHQDTALTWANAAQDQDWALLDKRLTKK